MGMSAWAIIAAPLMAASPAPEPSPVGYAAAPLDDVFSGSAMLGLQEMKDAAGGTDVAVEIGFLGLNLSDSDGTITDVSVNNSNNGAIAGNFVGDNNGITTVFNNTGNGVLFQSTVQININLNGGN